MRRTLACDGRSSAPPAECGKSVRFGVGEMDPWEPGARVDVITRRMTVVSGSGREKCRMLCRFAITAIAVGILTACGATGDVPSAEEEAAYAESAPPLDKAVDYFLYTHCGVESLRVDGRWWHAVEPLYGDDSPGSPPDGGRPLPRRRGDPQLRTEHHLRGRGHGSQCVACAGGPAREAVPLTRPLIGTTALHSLRQISETVSSLTWRPPQSPRAAPPRRLGRAAPRPCPPRRFPLLRRVLRAGCRRGRRADWSRQAGGRGC